MTDIQQIFSDVQLRRLKDKKRPVVAWMTAVLVVLCATLAAATAWVAWSSHDTRLYEAEVATANMAQALASQADMAMKLADVALEDMVERSEAAGGIERDGERLRQHLARLVGKAAEIHGLFIYDDKGTWIATSLATPQVGNNADREYFIFHQTHPDRGTHVGAPVRSRSTGHWIIPISRRLDRPDGSFAGVALATLRLDAFERVYDSLNLGRSGTVFCALDNGILIYRRPFRDSLIGTDVSSGPVFRTFRERGPAGTAMLMAKLDGIERLYSYRHLERFPVVVAAALSRDEIFARWRAFSLQVAAGALAAIAALVWFFRRLMRQIAIRDHVEAELRVASSGLERANAALRSIAAQDGLTELANRRRFDEVLDHELNRVPRSEKPVSLILLDVDFFKKYNDAFGHVAGDDCLRAVAAVVAGCAGRAEDLAARYGGEEFAVVLPGTDAGGALCVAESIREAVLALRISHPANPAGIVTVSLGVATACPHKAEDVDRVGLVRQADALLYQSKNAGRNRVSA